jgi:hypothetical protein
VAQELVPNPCSVVRENDHPGHGTVLVLGTPRGGTSVVAGICQMLGISMGRDIDRSNIEDRCFRATLEAPGLTSAAAEYFSGRTVGGRLTGVKNPVMIDRLAEYYAVIPRPILVVVTRDVLATAQREELSGSELLRSFHSVVRRKYAILELAEGVSEPLIFVSYERLIADPLAAVTALSNFLLGTADELLVKRTAHLVRPNCDMPDEVDFVHEREQYERQVLGAFKLVS